MSPFDRSLLWRSVLAMAGALVVVGLVVVATDEATSTAGMRVARLSALAPFIVAVAILGVTGHARARGELAALSALGLSPWEAVRGATVAGLFAALVVVAVLLSPWVDTASLFPVARPPLDWVVDPLGRAARASGVTLFSDGSFALSSSPAQATRSAPGALAALACVAPLALSVPRWAVTPMPAWTRVLSMGASASLSIVALHMVAAGRVAPAWSACAVLPLLAATALLRSRN